ncbi:MAG: polyphenol oxidase family protein [Patescibacteria group bacterium]
MKKFSPFMGLQIVYSHRIDGSFRDQDSVKNFLGIETDLPISFLQLEHSDQIISIDSPADQTKVGDSIITHLKHQVLSFTVGDCFPLVLFDSKKQVIALIHCGWKSLYKNLIALTFQQMHNTYQCEPKNIFAWIGPGICAKHYTQQTEPVQLQTDQWTKAVAKNGDVYSIDLKLFIKQELYKSGVENQNINDEDLCTYQNRTEFFSHRRTTNEGDEEGRFFITIWQQ